MISKVASRRVRKSLSSHDTVTKHGPPVTSLRLHLICVVQALLAACVFTVTEHDGHGHSFWCTVEMVLQTLVVMGATVFIRSRVTQFSRSNVILPILIMVVCLSLVCEPIQRLLLGQGHSFEMLIMHSQCNLMLALAACGFRMSYQRLSVLIAVFTAIFCCTISNASGLIPLVAGYALSALVWLVAAWWENVDRRVLKETRRGIPRLQLAATAIFPVLMIWGATGAGANRATHALEGFLPGSGGTGEYDPHSRGGVNDGDALVAGSKNIKSFAALEDAPFMDSDKPSLYDVFNETFDEPVRPLRKHERAVALNAELMEHVHRQISEARQAGREFSMLRESCAADHNHARDLNAHALFHVAGRTPAHLRMEVFELFDGLSWLAMPAEPPIESPRMRAIEDESWLSLPVAGHGYGIFSGTEAHSIKTSNLDGNVVPAPAHLEGVSIPDVNCADMYHVDRTGCVSLDRDSLPTMTPVNLVSHCVDRRAIGENVFIPTDLPATHVTTLPEGDDMERVRELAREITAGIPHGWQQITAIEQYLKKNCVLDRTAKLSQYTQSPVKAFLLETRRGPEYLFAGSAAVLLRSLGYPARVVSGFYARPDAYDAQRQHTPVHTTDAHLWCEVRIGASTWLTIEPSPGYELLTPPSTIGERLTAGLQAAWQAVVRNVGPLLLVGLLLVMALFKRRYLENALRTLSWRLAASRDVRARVTRLARLIDHRLRLAGLPRQSGTTLKRWANQPHLMPVRARLSRVADLADQAAFDPGGEGISMEPGELNRLATQLSLRELRRLNQTSPDLVG